MGLTILKWEHLLEKVCRICAEFTKMVQRINKIRAQNIQHFCTEFWQP